MQTAQSLREARSSEGAGRAGLCSASHFLAMLATRGDRGDRRQTAPLPRARVCPSACSGGSSRGWSKGAAEAHGGLTQLGRAAGRIVDSYTSIATGEALRAASAGGRRYARRRAAGRSASGYRQMRLITGFQLLTLSQQLAGGVLIGALSIKLRPAGQPISIGARPRSALRWRCASTGWPQWIMWEVSQLFENIGVVHGPATEMPTRSIAHGRRASAAELNASKARDRVRGRPLSLWRVKGAA